MKKRGKSNKLEEDAKQHQGPSLTNCVLADSEQCFFRGPKLGPHWSSQQAAPSDAGYDSKRAASGIYWKVI